MLILTRKQGTSVVVQIPPCSEPRELKFIVDRITAGENVKPSVRLAFSADVSITILRSELVEKEHDAHDRQG